VFISQRLYTIIPAIPGQATNYHFPYTVKNKYKNQNIKIFLIYKELQKGSVAKSYKRIEEGLPNTVCIYEEMRKYLTIYEEAVIHI
jgi:hypothetical protein